ncbi:virulence factor TspB C-terminal domain-related protein [Cupriavidus metallidurans]|uniref:virulence factor TspB C-terminal domain-related protein n=1 Tax=Cupriavidus metallidurans TaxID=119219 RepID=UPI00126A1500|nr:virulence factor TspB C-terminal domain-related protein [Cupriavidus metallidurans]
MLLAVVIAFGLSMGSEAFAQTKPNGSTVDYTTTGWWVANDVAPTCKQVSPCDAATAGQAATNALGVGKYTLYSLTLVVGGGLDGLAATVMVKSVADGSLSSPISLRRATKYVDPIPAPTCTQDAGKSIPGARYVVQSPSKLAYGVNFCLPVSGTSGGCAVGSVSRTGTLNLSTGKWEYIYWGPFTAVGQVCNGNGTGATDPVKDVPQICDAGLCQGTVNGVQVCVKCSQSDSATNKNQSTTNPDGSTTQTTTTTNVSFNDNSVTTNTTTTTTTTPAGGGTPTTTTKADGTTESKDSYCQRNPSDPNCKDQKGQVSGGDDCNAPPVCTGDAIQCAMVMQQFKTRCDMQKTDAAVVLGQQLATGQDPMASQLPNPSKADQVDLSSRLSNVDNMGITAQCMPDLHIPLGALPGASGGSSLNISTGPLCDFGKLFGILNLIGTTVLCAYMLRGSF